MAAAAALGSVESLMPLHSAVASARLRSFIAVDSSCWSWLSQGQLVYHTLQLSNLQSLVAFVANCALVYVAAQFE